MPFAYDLFHPDISLNERSPLSIQEVYRRYSSEIERQVGSCRVAGGLLGDMIDYHLSTGGKRMRALLPVWVCVNLGGQPEAAFDLGVGLELLHNATLVHDDLQDGDRMRRGRPTVWVRWGKDQAINAGDSLIFEGLGRIACAPAGPQLFAALSAALGRTVEGQTMELQMQLPATARDALSPTEESWDRMARGKTGALFGACLQAGAAAAGACRSVQEAAARYGEEVGVLFQVQDDYLDLVGDKGRERSGCDLLEGKRSFPVVWALSHGDGETVAVVQGLLETPRDQRTWEQVDEVLAVLERCGALGATAEWIVEATCAAALDPMAAILPGWVEQCISPVVDALKGHVIQ